MGTRCTGTGKTACGACKDFHKGKLPQKKREADQQNEARWEAERQQGQVRKHGRNDQSL